MSGFRVLVALFSFITLAITAVLIPAAYFGDGNSKWAKRLTVIASTAGATFLLSVFW